MEIRPAEGVREIDKVARVPVIRFETQSWVQAIGASRFASVQQRKHLAKAFNTISL